MSGQQQPVATGSERPRGGLRGWIDQRTGLDAMVRTSLEEPIPGGARWAYVFGSGLLYLFVSQVITGVFLALYYVPSADHAHTVVAYIVKEVTSGSFVRSIHAYGSSGIIILLALHIGQTVLYGSYKGRRELLWLSGCILFALMLGMAFTGYLLPWDQKAYFATAVGTNILAEVPAIGSALQSLIRGGSQMGTLTLSRFFVLHVLVLPGLIFAFVGAHVFFFRKAGPAGPISEDPVTPRLPPQPFYPRQVFMDAAFSIAIIGVLALFATHLPTSLGPAANPADTHFLPRPEWYYRPAFQALKYLSGRASILGILLPALLAALFALVPFLDRGRERRPWRRPVVIAAFALFLIGYIGLGVASYREDYGNPATAAQMRKQEADTEAFMKAPFVPEVIAANSPAPALLPGAVPATALAAPPAALPSQAPPASTHTSAASPQPTAAVPSHSAAPPSSSSAASTPPDSATPDTARGRALFLANGCTGCHGKDAAGTNDAPSLIGVGTKYSEAKITGLLKAPTPAMLDGGMEPVKLAPPQLADLVHYLHELQ